MVDGLPKGAVSVAIESDVPVAADRLMRWDASGYGEHAESGISAPSTVWYLAEGSTLAAFQLFYLLQNPGSEAATVTVTYLLPAPATPVVRQYAVPGNSRQNIWVNLEGPEFVHTDVSAAIVSTAPIIVERAMYLDAGGQMFSAGHGSMGVTQPALSWFLAEGATGEFFDLFILLANPGYRGGAGGGAISEVRRVDRHTVVHGRAPEPVHRLGRSGGARTGRRGRVDHDRVDQRGADHRRARDVVAPCVSASGTKRTTPQARRRRGRSGRSPASRSTGRTPTRPTCSWPTRQITAAEIRMTAHIDGRPPTVTSMSMPPHSRTNVPIAAPANRAADFQLAVTLESVGAVPAQIVVEVAHYRSVHGVFWAAGTNALATRVR